MPLSGLEALIYFSFVISIYMGPLFAILSLLLIFKKLMTGKWETNKAFWALWFFFGAPVFIVIFGIIFEIITDKSFTLGRFIYMFLFVATSMLLGKGFYSATKSAIKAIFFTIPTCLLLGMFQAGIAVYIYGNKVSPDMKLFGIPGLYSLFAIIAIIFSATTARGRRTNSKPEE